MDWSAVDYCDVFIILTAPIHCRDTDALTHFYKSDEEINSSTSRLARGQVHAQHMVISGWTIPLKRPGIDYNVLMCSLVSGRRYNHSLSLLYFKIFSSAACLVALSTLYFPAYLVFNLATALHSCVDLHRHLKGDRWCLLHGILLSVCPQTLMKGTSMNTFKRVFPSSVQRLRDRDVFLIILFYSKLAQLKDIYFHFHADSPAWCLSKTLQIALRQL